VTGAHTHRHPGFIPGSTKPLARGWSLLRLRRSPGGPRNKSGVTVWVGLAVLAASPAAAQTTAPARYADTQLTDPAREAEAKSLMEQVRCLTCEGQSVADSDADMAGDMRALIRERIEGGENAGQVRQWLIDRYGDQITYDPPMSALSAPLWLAPLALLAIGILIARRSFRRRRP
jgi:cytochrome c-type biogenesis protein CcmH